MRTALPLLGILILLNCCNQGNKIKIAENAFKGYNKIILKSDSIPEIRPDDLNMKVINVPNDIDKSIIDFSLLIDSIYYVNLETNNESLVGDIDKLLFYKNRILIIETLKRQSVLLFTDKGKFIRRIGKPGKGPEEFLSIRDVAIDYNAERIIILDGLNKKLLYFDFDGNYVKFQRLLYFSTNMSILNDGSYLYYQNRGVNSHVPSITEYNLIYAEVNQNITGKSLSYSYRDIFPKNTFTSLNSFKAFRDKVLFTPIFTNLIYEISEKNKIQAKYLINLGRKDVVKMMNKETTNQNFLDLLNTNNYFYFDGYAIESFNYLYLNIERGGDCYYSKQTNQLFYGNGFRFNSNYDNILDFEKPITSFNNYFVSVISPYKAIRNLKNKKLNDNLRNLADGLKEMDNPILFFYSLKSY